MGDSVFLRIQAVTASSDIEFPRNFDVKVKDLVLKLLEPKSEKRLTSVVDMAKHKFFEGINWGKLRSRRVEPPYRPPVNGADDTSMFDRYPIRESGANTISEEEQLYSDRFSTCDSAGSSLLRAGS